MSEAYGDADLHFQRDRDAFSRHLAKMNPSALMNEGETLSSEPTKRDKFMQTTQDISALTEQGIGIAGSIAALTSKPKKGGGKKATGGDYTPPPDTSWGMTEYAMIGGVVLFVGVGGYFLYRAVSK